MHILLLFSAVVIMLCDPTFASGQSSGLVTAYSFSEGSGNIVGDVSGNNNTGTLGTGVTWTTQGKFGNALVFNGSGLVTVPDTASLNLTSGMTLEAWVYPTVTLSGWRGILIKEGSQFSYFLYANTSSNNQAVMVNIGGEQITLGGSALPVNTWTHLAGTYDGTTVKLYRNGVQAASQPRSGPINPFSGPLRVGGNNSIGEYFQGLIDEVRVYNRALSQAEIQSDMNTALGGTPPPPDTMPPTAPSGLTPSVASGSQINLTWTASTDNIGVKEYRLERCQGINCANFAQIAISAATSVSDTGLAPATSYSYRVRAADLAGNTSGYSNVASGTTQTGADTTRPTAPAGLTATAVSTTQINLTWTASTDNVAVTEYRVERCQGTSCSNFVQVATTSGAAFSNTGLSSNTTYRFRVRAADAAGNLSTYSNTASAKTFAVDTTQPTAPAGLTATAVSTTQINLTWTASTDNVAVTEYRVERCQGTSCSNFVQVATTSGAAFSNTGLSSNTTYRFRVRAADAAGNLSTYSNIALATTQAAPDTVPPTAPAGLAATVVSATQIDLTWTTSSDNIGVSGYRVERCQGASCANFVEIGTAVQATFSSTGLNPETSYSYRVQATDAAANVSQYSNVATAVTSNVSPIAGLIAAYNFNEGSGATVADSSGNGNTGTLGSGLTWITQGKYGNSLLFSGSSFVTVPDSVSLNLASGMTLEAWLYPTTTLSGWKGVLIKEGASQFSYFLYANTSSNNQAVMVNIGGEKIASGGTAVPVNTWTHLAGTYDGSTVRLYRNGVQVAAQSQSGQINMFSGPLRIGGNNSLGEYFQGRIDEVRIYNRALSQAEIQSDINTPIDLGPPTGSDTVPPSVNITAPLSNATVESTVTVAASASDNVDVVGVQFFLDGAALGSEIPFAPFSTLWDTTTSTSGSHTLTARARDAGGNSTMSAAVPVTVRATTAATSGRWSAVANWPLVAVHATLLPTGDVLAWDGPDQKGAAFIWHPATDTFTSRNPPDNIFCAGHCLLPDGRLLVVGGHIANFVGIPDASIFNPSTNAWTQVRSMSYGRWYPTAIMLPDGRVLVVAGDDGCPSCVAAIPEIYDSINNTWIQLPGAQNPLPEYPHLFLLQDGRILATGSFEEAITTQVLDLSAQTWTTVDSTVRDGHSSVMYALGKFMKSGTSATSDAPYGPAATTTYVLDMNQAKPSWRQTAPMSLPRSYHNLTILPDGNVLATGGGQSTDPFDQNHAAFAAELWSPNTESWTTMMAMTVPRLYHSIALLLPDGRVLVAGGGRFGGGSGDDMLNAEIFSPPYLFKGTRPGITSAPNFISYNSMFSITTPDTGRIATVSLLPLGSVTHHFNANQRYLSLTFQSNGSGLDIQSPTNANIAPPGYYMLFIVDTNGVPSIASIIKIQ